jgi:hypothetical protein
MKQQKAPKYIATQVYPELDPTLKSLPYGQAKYGSLKRDYPQHFSSFWNMHTRSRRKGLEVAYDFRRNFQGLANLVECVGPVPSEMKSPTVGRRDHGRGYVPDNIAWQDRAENSREAALRNDLRHMPRRYKLVWQLLRAHPFLRSGDYVDMPSTLIAAIWSGHAQDVTYRSHDIPKYLHSIRSMFDGLVHYKVVEVGRGPYPTIFAVRIDPALVAEIDTAMRLTGAR